MFHRQQCISADQISIIATQNAELVYLCLCWRYPGLPVLTQNGDARQPMNGTGKA